MGGMGTYRRSTIIITSMTVCIFLLTKCVNDSGNKVRKGKVNDDFKKFAGSEVCANCHKDTYEKHIHTEHHLTSAIANEKNILGSFSSDANLFPFDPFTNVTMEKRDSGFYQVEYRNGNEIRKGRFDIIIGSGRKGQSYLNWLKNRLVQLPITYFSPAKQWSNSPGYYPNRPLFYRPITSRCLECHSTYFEKISDTERLEQFDHNKIIYGVDCEKCHGPAAAHVEFQKQNPEIKEAVHGNQLGLLSLSKCFTIGNVTCINCHNIHENENGRTRIFSQRCQTCHSKGHEKSCKMTAIIGPAITQNCIACHMPKQPSQAIAVYLQGANVPTSALLRTHYIKVYPEETKKNLSLTRLQKTKNR